MSSWFFSTKKKDLAKERAVGRLNSTHIVAASVRIQLRALYTYIRNCIQKMKLEFLSSDFAFNENMDCPHDTRK